MTDSPDDASVSPRTRREAARRDRTVAPGAATGRAAGRDPLEHAREHLELARGHARDHLGHAREQFEATNERIKQRTGRDLLLAILTGLLLGALVLASLLFVKWTFVILAVAAAGLATFELVRALQTGGRRIDVVPQLVAVPLILLPAFASAHWLHWTALFGAVFLIVVWRLLVQMAARDGRTYGDVFADVLASGLVPVYVSLLASLALALLRQPEGEWWVLAFLITAIAADTGAYAAGLAFGRHAMAPRISPKKTWEGFAGAALAALAAGALLAEFLLGLPWWSGLVFGAVILATATVGDLGESMLKRDLGIKDMSSWLPGHGGVLDRLDSILLSAAAAYALHGVLAPLGGL
ncbi:phosphatidate cytidylyltransferase [Microbacterium sp. Marseille-Q6965]|uniref:phosphatidate cytidylyltransferase n=1 Tax=Microbacterium sp. Marseille-Q6965 TaxID=2965072 RepID=UPI0021B82FF9|nr:phosphatidate cytidylyltransferase [Microbacterium sp. Marseille-Q6965]